MATFMMQNQGGGLRVRLLSCSAAGPRIRSARTHLLLSSTSYATAGRTYTANSDMLERILRTYHAMRQQGAQSAVYSIRTRSLYL
jgi:hypothetical protein